MFKRYRYDFDCDFCNDKRIKGWSYYFEKSRDGNDINFTRYGICEGCFINSIINLIDKTKTTDFTYRHWLDNKTIKT